MRCGCGRLQASKVRKDRAEVERGAIGHLRLTPN